MMTQAPADGIMGPGVAVASGFGKPGEAISRRSFAAVHQAMPDRLIPVSAPISSLPIVMALHSHSLGGTHR